MKKYISIIALIFYCVFSLLPNGIIPAKAQDMICRVYFTKGGEEISVLSVGEISANAEISEADGSSDLYFISALYDGDSLEAVEMKEMKSVDGLYSSKPINIASSDFDGKHMRAFVWDKNLSPIASTSIEKELEINSFSVTLDGNEYSAYINNDRAEIDVFVPSMVNNGNSEDIDYGIGSSGYDTAIKSLSPIIKSNALSIDDETVRDFSEPQLYKLKGKFSEKDYIARAHKTILQYSTAFGSERLLGSRETDAASYDIRRLGLPSMAGTGKAEWVWAASGATADTNQTQFVTDNLTGSRVFEVKKTDSAANADFYTHSGRVQSGVDCVVTELDICISELSDGGEIYIGGDGGNGTYNGRMALKLSKTSDDKMALSVIKGVNANNKAVTLASFDRKLDINKWHRIKTVHKLSFNNNSGYSSIYDICIDGDYIGSAICDEYSTDYRLNNVMTGFYSSDSTTFAMRLDNYSMQYCIGDETSYLSIEALQSVRELDSLLGDGVLDFLYETYDSQSGAFYYAISSRDTERFRPCIEASFFALNILRYGGALPKNNGTLTADVYPEPMRGRLIDFIKNMQSETDGYFYDEQWGTAIGDSKKTRDANEASEMLAWFGASPKYSYPWNRAATVSLDSSDSGASASLMSINSGGVSNNLSSLEQFTEYLNQMNWDSNIWSVGNELSSAKTLIESAGYADDLRSYLEARIDSSTGLWGDGQDIWKRIDGSMKLANFYTNTPYPYADKMIKTVIDELKYMDIEKFCNTCGAPELWNPFELLSRGLSASTVSYADRKYIYDNISDIIDKVLAVADRFRKPDGGYSYNLNNSSKTIQGCEASLGLYESDMDATVMFSINIRRSVYSILGLEMTKPLSGEKGRAFIQKLSEKQ